ncbi:MAG: RNA polymerase sigma factor [Sphingobacteriales bacterium]|nr:MAG: RNA polymerase sigma factor [Sphingobacteriales bacterium]
MLPEQLLQHIAAGDQAAFRQFYELFKGRVYNTSLSYLQDQSEAEEVTQDVFVEVYHNAKNFQARSSASTWIYRITINKSLDRLRHKNRKKRFAFISSLFNQQGSLQHDAPDFIHPGVLIEQRENAVFLFKAMKELPENQHTAFLLKHIEGLSQKEIAQIMNITEKAVESLLSRAKYNLRKLLNDFFTHTEGLN